MIEVNHLYLDSVNVLFVDLALFLCSEPGKVQASKKTFIKEKHLPGTPMQREKVDVDDSFVAMVEFKNSTDSNL